VRIEYTVVEDNGMEQPLNKVDFCWSSHPFSRRYELRALTKGCQFITDEGGRL
jgi:hypothetical protein